MPETLAYMEPGDPNSEGWVGGWVGGGGGGGGFNPDTKN